MRKLADALKLLTCAECGHTQRWDNEGLCYEYVEGPEDEQPYPISGPCLCDFPFHGEVGHDV